MKTEPEDNHAREAVEVAVQRHFEDMKIDYGKLVFKFLKIKKDEKNDHSFLYQGKKIKIESAWYIRDQMDQLYNLRKNQRQSKVAESMS